MLIFIHLEQILSVFSLKSFVFKQNNICFISQKNYLWKVNYVYTFGKCIHNFKNLMRNIDLDSETFLANSDQCKRFETFFSATRKKTTFDIYTDRILMKFIYKLD